MSDKILSQEEIEALLKAVPKKEGPLQETREKKISEYDFRRQSGATREHFPIFNETHNRFSFTLQRSLRSKTNKMTEVKVSAVDIIPLGEFVSSCQNPSYITTFQFDGIAGDMFIVMEPSIVHSLVDIYLGGDGFLLKSPNEITHIESALLPTVMEELFEHLKSAWSEIILVNIKVISHITNPLLIASTESVVPMLWGAIEISSGGVSSGGVSSGGESSVTSMTIRLAYTSEVASRLGASGITHEKSRFSRPSDEEFKLKASEVLKTHELDGYVELSKTYLSVRELLDLEVGDVILLPMDTDSEFMLYIGGRKKWFGKVGTYKKRLLFKATRVYVEDE